MRICYIAHGDAHFLPPYVDYFSRAGHEIHVISPHPDDVPNAQMHHPFGQAYDPMKASGWQYFAGIPKVKNLLNKIQPDIVHAHYLTSNGLMAAFSGFHPVVITAHGSDVNHAMKSPFRRRLIAAVMKRADLVNPVSSDLEKSILELGIPQEKILNLTLGIEIEPFLVGKKIPSKDDCVRILCTRKMFPVYQCDNIINAAAVLKQKEVDFELVFAASGPLESELKKMTTELGLTGQIAFMGGYQLPQLPQLLADADIYVSASRSDGTSLSLLEAMVAGSFPVVSDIPANRLWLKGTGDGLFFPVGDAQTLATCLEKAISDNQLRRWAIDENRQKVLEKGDRAKNMAILHEHYKRLIQSKDEVE
jgi:glycosyltransferase involved in cell wall biosynthesis